MYKIWFKWALGGDECFADCQTIELARRTWDALNDAGAFMMCTNLSKESIMEDYVVIEYEFDEVITLE